MKNRLIGVLLGISLLGLLTACGSNDANRLRGVTKDEYEEARQAVIDADRAWRDENLF